jgi:ribosomal protein L7/L12
MNLIQSGRKIDAIKLYRELHGTGLKEAKDAVESLERRFPAQPTEL